MPAIQLGPHQQLEVVESSPETLLLDARWEPGGHPPIAHLHPSQDEEFEVLAGELAVTVDGIERTLTAGERLTIPRGSVHAMWNASDAPARATWRVTPALRTLEMFETIAAGGVPDFLERFSAEFRLVT
jgi:mannose-6-phosphate isomerase-like protein (cupin superfamily)